MAEKKENLEKEDKKQKEETPKKENEELKEKNELQAKQQELDDLTDRYKRILAEFENHKNKIQENIDMGKSMGVNKISAILAMDDESEEIQR